jgi:Rrf2 family protein
VENRDISGISRYTDGAPIHPSGTVELSCKSEYALLALLELTTHHNNGEPLQIRQIAAEQKIPDRYLEQLLATLRRAGILRSQRGARGGYLLAKEPWQISLWDVVNCIEGVESKDFEKAPQSVESMVIRDVWRETQRAADAILQKYTLQDLADQRNARKQSDVMYYI